MVILLYILRLLVNNQSDDSVYRYLWSILLSIIILLTCGSPAHADDWLKWQSSNIQYLKGNEFELGEPSRQIITIEYANQWKYGDLFVFVDGGRIKGGETTAYGEISPRLSMSRMTGRAIGSTWIKDVFLSFNYEQAEQNKRTYLYGLGMDFQVPAMKFFKTNLYLRDKPDIPGINWQLTMVWKSMFMLGSGHWVAEGFADLAGNEGETYHANQLIVPRLLFDLGRKLNLADNRLLVGIEYSYWRHKFGVKGATERNPQLQIMWIF